MYNVAGHIYGLSVEHRHRNLRIRLLHFEARICMRRAQWQWQYSGSIWPLFGWMDGWMHLTGKHKCKRHWLSFCDKSRCFSSLFWKCMYIVYTRCALNSFLFLNSFALLLIWIVSRLSLSNKFHHRFHYERLYCSLSHTCNTCTFHVASGCVCAFEKYCCYI